MFQVYVGTDLMHTLNNIQYILQNAAYARYGKIVDGRLDVGIMYLYIWWVSPSVLAPDRCANSVRWQVTIQSWSCERLSDNELDEIDSTLHLSHELMFVVC